MRYMNQWIYDSISFSNVIKMTISDIPILNGQIISLHPLGNWDMTKTITPTRRPFAHRHKPKTAETNNPSMKRLQEKEDETKEAFTIEGLALDGLEIVESHKGYFLCSFIIPSSLSDGDGNWHVGAMATLIDSVGAVAINFSAGGIKASLDFNISYYNTAKIHEEVMIEAKVVREMEGLSAVLVEIRNKSNGQLVALGKQWLASKRVTLGKASKL